MHKIPNVKLSFFSSRGKLYEEEFQQPAQAASIYVQILSVVPDHLPAIRSLQAIYREGDDLAPLAESYLAELAVSKISKHRRVFLHIACAELLKNIWKRKSGRLPITIRL